MDPFTDPLAIAIISQLRQNTEQEALEYTPDEKSIWQLMMEAGVRLGAALHKAKESVSPVEDDDCSSERITGQFDQNCA